MVVFIMYYAHFRCRFSVTGYLSNLAPDELCPFGDEIAEVLVSRERVCEGDDSRIYPDRQFDVRQTYAGTDLLVYKWFIKIRGKVELKRNIRTVSLSAPAVIIAVDWDNGD